MHCRLGKFHVKRFCLLNLNFSLLKLSIILIKSFHFFLITPACISKSTLCLSCYCPHFNVCKITDNFHFGLFVVSLSIVYNSCKCTVYKFCLEDRSVPLDKMSYVETKCKQLSVSAACFSYVLLLLIKVPLIVFLHYYGLVVAYPICRDGSISRWQLQLTY